MTLHEEIAMTTTYQKSEQIVDRHVRDERILVPIGGHIDELDALFTLNDVAAVIWDGALAGKTESEIADLVMDNFDVDRATATDDTRELLQQFIELGALHPLERNP